ncbi:hypothetical protein [Anoxybacillus flavithermus]|uniref:hypothetical protein n=1 Tax=Anoxybacillus flavithermus TaxID=33934 RepID=UPI0018679068|nr:hypothetical protein [Anoxybacillus flavithermus]MBE2914172.1 hypothetical protein [Anoxybacillus flavithermus]
MERILTKKRERLIFYMYNFVLRIFLILIAAKLCLDYFPHGFWLYAVITYLTMLGGAFIYKRMYIPTYEMVVIQDGKEKVPVIFTYAMLTAVMIVCVFGGILIFFHQRNIFSSVFIPFFFFMGAFIWELTISQMIDVLNERDIKVVIRK